MYSSSFNEGEIRIYLPNLFNSKLCQSSSNHNINNLKDYGDFEENNKEYGSSHSQNCIIHPKDIQVGKKDSLSLFIKLTLFRSNS